MEDNNVASGCRHRSDLARTGVFTYWIGYSPISPWHDRGAYSAGVAKAVVLGLLAVGLRLVGRRCAGLDHGLGS